MPSLTRSLAGVKPLAGRVLQFIYPPRCMGCGDDALMGQGLCSACFGATHFLAGPACDACGQPLQGQASGIHHCDQCSRYPQAWGRGAAALVYGGTGRRLVLALKHGDRLDLAPQLARWMARTGRHLLDDADLVAPIPLHWRRLAQRRYNQSAELLRHLPAPPHLRKVYDLLSRPEPTRSQDGLGRVERRENLRGKIVLRDDYRALVAGRTLLLVDDVLTTGATLSAASEAALSAGARAVNMLVLARVAPPE